jgi:hypothetical protein
VAYGAVAVIGERGPWFLPKLGPPPLSFGVEAFDEWVIATLPYVVTSLSRR